MIIDNCNLKTTNIKSQNQTKIDENFVKFLYLYLEKSRNKF